MTFKLRVLLAIALLMPVAPSAAQHRGVTAEDYFAFQALSDPRFSPDGTTIAFVVTTVDEKANRRRSAIWSVPHDAAGATADVGHHFVEQPRWSRTAPRWRFCLQARAGRQYGGRAETQI